MSFEKISPLGTYNQYGPREVGRDNVGNLKTFGARRQLIIDITGDYINDVISDGESRSLSVATIPAGSLVETVYVDVETAFTLTGTSPTLDVGTEGSESTNGFVVAESELENTGVTDVSSTLTGTWASELAAETQIGFALGGSSPTIADGKGRIVIEYVKAK